MRKFKVGDIVKRIRGSFNGVVEGGVYEVSEVHGNDAISIVDESGTYDATMFELSQEATPTTPREFKVGDHVRMISKRPKHGSGEVRFNDVGVITSIETGAVNCRIDFPRQTGWAGNFGDLEHAHPEPSAVQIPEVSLDEAVANWQNVAQQIKELQAQASNYERVMRRNGIKPI